MIIYNTDLFRANDIQKYLRDNKLNTKTSLYKIILNAIDDCNRKCDFCPRGNGYSYAVSQKVMPIEILNKICEDVGLNFTGTFTFGGFGEPTMLNNIDEYVRILRKKCPKSIITVTTNGYDLPKIIDNQDINKVELSLYEPLDEINMNKIKSSNTIFSIKDINKAKKFFHNRGGNIKNVEDVKLPIEECCNFPFYKMFIDSNGDVLLCCSDWNRKEIVGNVMNTNIYSIWKNNFYKYRKDLLNKKRNSSICRECSMNGILAGNEFKNFWREYYDKNNRQDR